MPSEPSKPLPHVQKLVVKGREYLYYRRGTKRWPLPGPENSPEFLYAYHNRHRDYTYGYEHHTVDAAISGYLSSADFLALSPVSQRNYRYYLDQFRQLAGTLPLSAIDVAWVDKLRDQWAEQPNFYNALLSRMRQVVTRYKRLHPDLTLMNAWAEARFLATEESDQNRPWPDEIISAVRREATPEFRALIDTLLLTGQRIGDVCQLGPSNWDAANCTLSLKQNKTGKMVVLFVPPALTAILTMYAGRVPGRLLATPRGKAWSPDRAEDALRRIRNRLGMPRYTIHGLRATGPTALKMLGMDNRLIRELTGHETDQNLEVYLRGVAGHSLAKQAGEVLATRFTEVVDKTTPSDNQRRFSGVTGRAAAKTRSLQADKETGKPLANWQTSKGDDEIT